MAERWLVCDQGKNQIKPEHKMRLAAHLAAKLWRSGQRFDFAPFQKSCRLEWRQRRLYIAA